MKKDCTTCRHWSSQEADNPVARAAGYRVCSAPIYTMLVRGDRLGILTSAQPEKDCIGYHVRKDPA